MAESKPITADKIIEKGIIKDNFQKELVDLVAYIPVFEKALLDAADHIDKAWKNLDLGGLDIAGLAKFNSQFKDTNDLLIMNEKLLKAKAQTAAALHKERQEEIKTTLKENQLTKEETKLKEKKVAQTVQEIAQNQLVNAQRKEAVERLKATLIVQNTEIGTLKKLNAENTLLRIARANLIKTDKTYGEQLGAINAKIDANNHAIIVSSDTLKRNKMNVGNYADSIRDAFTGTGILGDTLNKYVGIVTLVCEKVALLTGLFTAQTAAEEANNVATETNTVVTEEAAVAEKASAAALEAQTVATKSATGATEGLAVAMEFLKDNPIVLIIAGLVAVGGALYETVTATQAGRDALGEYTGAAYASAKATLLNVVTLGKYGGNANEVGILTAVMIEQEHELAKARIESIGTLARLNAEAQEARLGAMEEGKTTADRIDLLGVYNDKIKKQFDLKKKLADDELQIAKLNLGILKLQGDGENRAAKEQLENAQAQNDVLEAEQDSHLKKSTKMRTGLIKQYHDDTVKMSQDAQREEIELIDAFSKYKAQQLTQQLSKDLKMNKLDTDQAIENLKYKQRLLGNIEVLEDGRTIDHTAEFERELEDLKKIGASKAKQLKEKTNEELSNLQLDFQAKQIELETKYRAEINKLDEDYMKQLATNKKQEQEIGLKNTEYAIEQEQNKITKLEEQRNIDLASGKAKYKLTLKDLKDNFARIDKLNKDYLSKKKQELKSDAKFNKATEEKKTEDAIQQLKDRHAKEAVEREKEILNKTKDQKQAQAEIDTYNTDLAQNEATEIEKIKRDSAAVIEGIETKQQADLTDADRDALRKQEALEKQKTKAQLDAIENRKKIFAEEKKLQDDVTDGIKQGLQTREELEQASIQRTIDMHQRSIDAQTQLAAAGKANVLGAELAAADKAEEKKIQAQKRAAKVQENITLIKTFSDTLNSALEKDEPFFKAFGEAVGATDVVKEAFAKLFGGTALDGTESTGGAGDVDDKGGKWWVLHPDERVLNKKQNKKLNGVSNEQLVNTYTMFKDIYTPNFKSANVSTTQSAPAHDYKMTATLTNEIQLLRKTIENKPVESLSLDGLGEWTSTIQRKGFKKITHHKLNLRSIRRTR